MPTLIELEQELRRLKEKQDTLESQLKSTPPRPSRPDFALTDILNIENGHTVWARVRHMPLTVRSANSNTLNGNMDWPDAVASYCVVGVSLPTDWVNNTPITFVVGILQTATAGSPDFRWDSSIGTSVVNVNTTSGL